MVTLLDGPVGTELARRGVDLSGVGWSAAAARACPELLTRIHRDYAEAGATVHTANTFRTTGRAWGAGWAELATDAVRLARAAVPQTHRVAGSIAPLEDCYHPERSPPQAQAEHAALARVLADAGVDLLLCETFPHVGEAVQAVRAAVATGLPTWLALTAGPDASLLGPSEVRDGAGRAVDEGADAVLVNCVAAVDSAPFVDALRGLGVPFGVYANAGRVDTGIGWGEGGEGPERFAALARAWIAAGATLVGGCCGTTPAHIRALAALPEVRTPRAAH